jgi:hypothetical protein
MMNRLVVLFLLALPALATPPPLPMAERVTAAATVQQSSWAGYQAGLVPLDQAWTWSVRLMEAERAAGMRGAGPAHVKRVLAMEERVKDRVNTGMGPASDLDAVRYYVVDARIRAVQ